MKNKPCGLEMLGSSSQQQQQPATIELAQEAVAKKPLLIIRYQSGVISLFRSKQINYAITKVHGYIEEQCCSLLQHRAKSIVYWTQKILGRYYLIKFIFYLLFVDVLIAMNEQVVSFEYPPVEEDDSLTQSTGTRVIYDRVMSSKIYFEIPTFQTFE